MCPAGGAPWGPSHHPTRPLRPDTHSILRLPSNRPLPSTISTQFFTGSSSGLEKSICTFTGLRTRAWSSSYRETGVGGVTCHSVRAAGAGQETCGWEDVTEDEGREDSPFSPPKCQDIHAGFARKFALTPTLQTGHPGWGTGGTPESAQPPCRSQAPFPVHPGKATISSQDSLVPLRERFHCELITVLFLDLPSLVLFLPLQPGSPLP